MFSPIRSLRVSPIVKVIKLSGKPKSGVAQSSYSGSSNLQKTIVEGLPSSCSMFGTISKNWETCDVEVCTNMVYGSVCVNVKLDYKTQDEWRNVLQLAFETYNRFGRR